MTEKHESWAPCPEGEIGSMVQTIRAGRRRRAVSRIAAAAALVFLLAVGVGVVASVKNNAISPRTAPEAAMNCSQAVKLFAGYRKGTLDAETKRSMARHLDHCPACRERYEHSIEKGAGDTLRGAPTDVEVALAF